MKVKKKWLSLLTVVMMAAVFVLPGAKEALAAGAPVVSSNIGNVAGNVGDVITVPITFTSSDDNLRAIHGEPAYDKTVLEFQKAEYPGLPAGMPSLAGGNFGYVTSEPFSSGTVNLKFKVLKCTSDPVTITINNLYYSNSEGLDGTSTSLTSTVTISHPADKNQVEETKATCTTAGHKKVTCGLCGTILSDTDIPALGHDEGVWKVVKEATCKEKGSKELRCTRDNFLLKTEEIPLKDHTWDEGKVTKEATCKEKGVKTFTCKVCGDTKTEEIPLAEHTWDEGKVSKEATCKEEGVKTFTCKVCGDTKTEAIPVVDHTWVTGDDTDKDGWKVVVKATTAKEGSKERVCSVCGEKETQTIAKLTAETKTPSTTKPSSTGKTNAPKTGDPSINILYVVLILVAAGGVAVFAVAGHRKKTKKNN